MAPEEAAVSQVAQTAEAGQWPIQTDHELLLFCMHGNIRESKENSKLYMHEVRDIPDITGLMSHARAHEATIASNSIIHSLGFELATCESCICAWLNHANFSIVTALIYT